MDDIYLKQILLNQMGIMITLEKALKLDKDLDETLLKACHTTLNMLKN